jgi:hypothetical protein
VTPENPLNICEPPEGVEPGQPLAMNPQAGTYTFSTFSVGQRDADGDGYENGLDTCAQAPNVGNPRVGLDGDLDSDGLDAACDPDDNTVDSDEDADGYQNRQDNCPLDPNGELDEQNQLDTDKDQVGDLCDPNPDDADAQGTLSVSDLSAEVTIGGGGEGGPPACAAEGGADGVECWYEGYPLDVTGGGGGDGDTPAPSDGETEEPTEPGETPDATDGDNGDDDGGSNTGVIIGVIVAVIAAVAIIGGGAAMMMRRRGE